MFYSSSKSTVLLLRKNILNKDNTTLLLENINISFKHSTNLILKGKNGSGKTSLLNYLNINQIDLISYNNFNLIDYFGKINLINYKYFNLLNLFNFKNIQKNFKNLSYGYKKFYILFLNWIIKKNIYLYDEPFNGLDKYFLSKINSLFIYIYTIKSSQIKSYHNKVHLTNFSYIFLD